MLEFNEAGYGRATNEYKLYEILESSGNGLNAFKKQYPFAPGCIIDYYGIDPKTHVKILVEVKNWFLKIKDIQQLVKYLVHATELYGEKQFRLIIIAAGLEESRRKILDKLGIEIHLTKEMVQ